MANIKIGDLVTLTDPISTDVLPIVDVSADTTNKISIEELLKNAAAGTASLPAFAFDADPNTGMYRSGTDALAFSTGGTGRLFIDSSGRVGLGTSSPNHKLTLEQSGTATFDALNIRNGNTNSTGYQTGISSTGDVFHWNSTNSDIFFATNNAERMRIDSSGRLLVATSISRIVEDQAGNGPQGKIQIEATNSDAIMSIISAGTADATRAGTLSLGRHRNSTVGGTPTVVQSGDTLGAICFAGGDGTDMRTKGAVIKCDVDGTPGSNDMPGRLVFSTTADGASNPTERMRIDSSGNVGIGTTTPGEALDVNGTVKIGNTKLYSSGSGGTFDLRFQTYSGGFFDRVAITGAGNVGIGTMAPGRTLDVSGSIRSGGSTNPYIALNDETTEAYFEISGSETRISSGTSQPLLFRTGSDERMRIDSSGNVGLGTSSPSTQLHLVGPTASNYLRIDGSTGYKAFLGVQSGAAVIYAQSNTNGDAPIAFYTGSSERMRINSSGNVGIGTSSIDASLHVKGANTHGSFVLEAGGTTGSSNQIYIQGHNHAGTSLGEIHIEETATNQGALVFKTNGGSVSERMRIDSSGRLLVGTATSQDSNSYIQNYRASGHNETRVQSNSLSNGEICIFGAKAKKTGGTDNTVELGLYKHSGVTNPSGYMRLPDENLTASFMWNDTSQNFRTSTDPSHIGTTSGTVVGTQTSDERLKNVGANVAYGLAEVKQLQPKQYALKTEPDTNKLGFIAQQVESIIPEAVFDTDEELDGHQEGDRTKLGMEYVQLIPVLVNAIKELSAEVDTLKTKVAALEAAN